MQTLTMDWLRGKIEARCAEARKNLKQALIAEAVLAAAALGLYLAGLPGYLYPVLVMVGLLKVVIGSEMVLHEASGMKEFRVERKEMWGFIPTWFGQRNLLVRQPCWLIYSGRHLLDVLAADSFRLEGELGALCDTLDTLV